MGQKKVSLFSVTVLAFVVTMFLFGCSKENFSVAKVTVHNTGLFNKGGCGWVLVVDSLNYYETENLPTSYNVEGQQLTVTYRELQKTPDCTNSKYVKGVIYIHKVQ